MNQPQTLGNQTNRRKTQYDNRNAEDLKKKILSGKPKRKPGMPSAFKKKDLETKTEHNGVLQWNDFSEPYFKLTEMKDTLVRVWSKESYDELMQVFEVAGWYWNKEFRYDIPTSVKMPLSNFGVSVEEEFAYSNVFTSHSKVMDLVSFYNEQRITHEDMTELNKWFEEKKPDRASKK
jgi:hypothetical protein